MANTPEQYMALVRHNKERKQQYDQRIMRAMIDHPYCNAREIADLVGCDVDTVRKRQCDEEFMAKYHEYCKTRFSILEHAAIQKLGELIEKGNFQAVKFQLENMGYVPTKKVEQKTQTVINVDVEDDDE